MKYPGLQYTSPKRFTFRQRLMLFFLPPLIAFLLKAIFRTCRFEVRREEYLNGVLEKHGAFICPFWHECLHLVVWKHGNTNAHTLTSYSFDGELAARVVTRIGNEAIRGSSSRGGAEALDSLEKALHLCKRVGFTADGPRGPRRVAKPGIAILSARTNTPIVPNAYAISRSYRLRSWDHFPVLLPFSRVICAFAPPIAPPADQSPEAIESTRLEVERSLNALHREIERELGDEQDVPAPQ